MSTKEGRKEERAVALAKVNAALQRMTPKQRLTALLEDPEAKALVRQQAAEDLYVAIVEVGLADTMDIVQLASPAQFRTFLDLAGWKRDRIDSHEVLTWLRAARGDDDQEFFDKVDALDLEMLEVMLLEFTKVHSLEEDPDVNPEGSTIETPENKYLIEMKVEGAEEAALRRLIADLTGRDPFQFTRLLEALRWELNSDLEEAAHQFRSGRLQDLGFPPMEEVVQLFSFVPAPPVAADAVSTGLVASSDARILEAAAQGLQPDEWQTWEGELRYLVNSALVAEAADPGDLDAIRRVSEMTRDYLSLGLERLTGGNAERGTEVLRSTPSRRLFQIGFSATLEVKYLADALAREAGQKLRLLPYEASVIAALRRKRPMRALKVEGAEAVPFRNRRELDEMRGLVQRARAQHAILSRIAGGDGVEVGPSLHAAVAWSLLGETPSARPLPVSIMTKLSEQLSASDGGQRAEGALARLAENDDERREATRLAKEGFEQLRHELGAVLRSGRPVGIETNVILPIAL